MLLKHPLVVGEQQLEAEAQRQDEGEPQQSAEDQRRQHGLALGTERDVEAARREGPQAVALSVGKTLHRQSQRSK